MCSMYVHMAVDDDCSVVQTSLFLLTTEWDQTIEGEGNIDLFSDVHVVCGNCVHAWECVCVCVCTC